MAAKGSASPEDRAVDLGATRVTFRGHEGITLVGDAYGARGAPPVLLMHGGGQTRHAWGGTASALGRAGYRAVALDGRGHGESDWSPSGTYAADAFIADVKAVIAELSTSSPAASLE